MILFLDINGKKARNQDFLWGGGEGAYVKNWDQIVNIGMIRHGSCEDTRTECQTYGLTEIGTSSETQGWSIGGRKFKADTKVKSSLKTTPFETDCPWVSEGEIGTTFLK